ncbi:MAG TPA: GreA/GreB family elongation factor [Phnomibacter sp.]|nr:GreA/GreB family elongation factor [Phnomibacter sp.]
MTTTNTPLMTPQGLSRLQQKLENMYDRLKALQAEKAHAYHASGDGWHDNPGWLQLGQQEEQLSEDIQKVQHLIASAKIVEAHSPNPLGPVQIGSTVHYTLQPLNGGKASTWLMEIAGTGESNIREKRMSYDSPIGKALMGQTAGAVVEVMLPTGKFKLILQKVE